MEVKTIKGSVRLKRGFIGLNLDPADASVEVIAKEQLTTEMNEDEWARLTAMGERVITKKRGHLPKAKDVTRD